MRVGVCAVVLVVQLFFADGGLTALNNVNLDIRRGEIRAIIGPNGAGKTSMLNVINGFYHPQQGTITFKGAPRKQMRPYVAELSRVATCLTSRTASRIFCSEPIVPGSRAI